MSDLFWDLFISFIFNGFILYYLTMELPPKEYFEKEAFEVKQLRQYTRGAKCLFYLLILVFALNLYLLYIAIKPESGFQELNAKNCARFCPTMTAINTDD
ncbi:hypothetical protein BT63DRAFT_423417 [Microthyrium microscopicum]|uniref:Uncharacterized protein n=1 Tax=Microthyrium microscopicum TaxID=703497 RepID=A0A6A6UJF6_9PEZI|nr:hypothetical protein BT63DRAFT_423417 [Microthyrium microscopicum]